MMETPENNLENQFLSDSLSYESYQGNQKQYLGSEQQLQSYSKIYEDDPLYQRYIINTFGSFDNYKNTNRAFSQGRVYNPLYDHIVDTTVITEDANYKTDHISASEIIMEAMGGICSFQFIKKNYSAQKVMGTLLEKYMPGKEKMTRRNFFSPLPGERIVVWDINRQKWTSFFMSNLFKFVRDDTSGLE